MKRSNLAIIISLALAAALGAFVVINRHRRAAESGDLNRPPVVRAETDKAEESPREIAPKPDVIDEFDSEIEAILAEIDASGGHRAEALREAGRKAAESELFPNSLSAYEEYVRQFPDAPENRRLLPLLARLYYEHGLHDDARRMYEAAIDYLGDDSFARMIEIDLVENEIAADNFDAAEKLALEIMARPEPADLSDAYTVRTQMFLAPLALAEIQAERGQMIDAHETLKRTAEVAYQMTIDNPEVGFPATYISVACNKRIDIIFDEDPSVTGSDIDRLVERAQDIADECRSLFPGKAGDLDLQIQWRVHLLTTGGD